MTKPIITQERLKELFDYDPETGLFTRLKISSKHTNKKYGVGTVANYIGGDGYILIRLGRGQYLAHRLAFLYMTGSIPNEADHINRNRSDNRWDNLRAVSRNENMRNKSEYKNNTTGCTGVNKVEYGYLAVIGVNGVRKTLGFYVNFEDAVSSRKSAEIEHGYRQ